MPNLSHAKVGGGSDGLGDWYTTPKGYQTHRCKHADVACFDSKGYMVEASGGPRAPGRLERTSLQIDSAEVIGGRDNLVFVREGGHEWCWEPMKS